MANSYTALKWVIIVLAVLAIAAMALYGFLDKSWKTPDSDQPEQVEGTK